MAFSRWALAASDLRLRARDLLALAHLLRVCRWRCAVSNCALRLHQRDLGVVGQFLRERALLHQFDAAFVDLLRGFEGLLGGLRGRPALWSVVDHGGAGGCLVVRLRPDRAGLCFR